MAPGTIFAIFAGIYFWFPKVTGKKLNETLGKIHFWFSFIFMNGIFMPMFLQGIAGVSSVDYQMVEQLMLMLQIQLHYNEFMSWSAWLLGLAQIPFIINMIMTLIKKKKRKCRFQILGRLQL